MRKILILTLASLGVLLGASPGYASRPAPTGLSVTGKTTSSVSLDWDDYPRDPSVITQYRVGVYNSAGRLLSTRLTGSKTSAYTVTGLSPSTGYRFAVAVQFSGGDVSKYSSRVRATTDAVAVACPDGQYKAEYFANETLSGSPGITRCEASVNNTWADGQSPGTGIPNEDFSARYTGRIGFAGGDYEFKVTVDDGARLYVDGELVIDKWFQQAPTTYTAKRTLAAGFHDIKVEYYDTHLSGTIRLEITNVTTPNLPSSVVYVAPTEGAKVSGVTPVRVRAPAGTDWIGVYACGGGSVGEDLVMDANGEWSVQWDTQTTACSNGPQNLDTWAFSDDGSELGHATITVEVSNSSPPPPDPGPTPCEPSAEPGPVAGQGYVLRFSDCFGTLSRTVWCSNQWWEPNPPHGAQYVSDGVLHLVRRRSDGYANVTVSSEPCGQANPKSFRQGYFEARMRYDTVRGNGPAFWLLSTRHATNSAWPSINPVCAQQGLPRAECLTSELDVFEGFGQINVGAADDPVHDFFSGALHRNTGDFYGQPNQFRFVQKRTGLDLSQWHTYAARWTGPTVSYYIDGRLMGSVSTFDSSDQPMHLLFYNWNTGWEDENMPNANTPDQLDVSVDWVRVWQQ
jgi:PA14 domain/Fibronectin type III domain/Glycosyl hydrolases family 16